MTVSFQVVNIIIHFHSSVSLVFHRPELVNASLADSRDAPFCINNQ